MMERSGIDRFFIMLTGFILLLFGLHVFFDPVIYIRKFGLQINLGEYHKLVGFILSSSGGLVLYLMLKKKNINKRR